MKVLLYICLLVITLVAPAICMGLYPGLFVALGNDHLNWLSVYGVFISYLGLLFSTFAAVEVYGLSKKYLRKIRLPDEFKTLSEAATSLSEVAAESPRHILSLGIFSRVLVSIRAIKKLTKNVPRSDFKTATKHCEALQKWVHENREKDVEVQSCPEFWLLYEDIRQITEEISNIIDDEKAT